MSFEHDIRRIMRLDIDSSPKLVLLAVRHHGDEGGLCRVTVEKLVQVTALARATVFRHLGELVESGNLIRVEKGVYRVADRLMVRRSQSHGETVGSHGETVKVSQRDGQGLMVRRSPTPPNKVLSSIDGEQAHPPAHVHTREAAARPTSGTSTPTSGTSTPTPPATRPDPVEAILRGHPMAERLRPYVEVCLSILGTTPDIFTAESWLARGYSLARVRFGLGQARQAMGPGAPAGRVIVSAGNWMLRAEKHEYAHLEPKPVETPPAETTRREMTPEERAAALAKLDALLDDMPRRDGPSREGCA